jgi:hypothetical protein
MEALHRQNDLVDTAGVLPFKVEGLAETLGVSVELNRQLSDEAKPKRT